MMFMRAAVIRKYGPLENITLEELPIPETADDEVLVAVRASSITFSNLALIIGKPLIVRLAGFGVFKPKYKIPGSDIAGRVEKVGRKVKKFKPGDEVYGDLADMKRGGFAEFVSVPETAIAIKPANQSFEEAAAVPESAHVALQAIRDHAKVKPEEEVLVIGACGGIGSFAVQFAKYYQANVTGLCSKGNFELAHSLGATRVIDYKRENFSRLNRQFDSIIACVGNYSIYDYRRALKPRGRLVITGGSMKQLLQCALLGPILSRKYNKGFHNMLVKPNVDLNFIRQLIESGHIRSLIDKCYRLTEIESAFRHYKGSHSRGKVIISIKT
ncbi:Alcohol dehydrogenase [Olavius algarvensis spirochete endosymbiont]|nr:Alcohol dehydrogenase [Olavius algarvensis spirochete endosymbiont]